VRAVWDETVLAGSADPTSVAAPLAITTLAQWLRPFAGFRRFAKCALDGSVVAT
jgi:hypothetical protein